jgi:hypothetical protein
MIGEIMAAKRVWLVVAILAMSSDSVRPPDPATGALALADLAFIEADLVVSTANIPVQDVITSLPNSSAWRKFLQERSPNVAAWIDARSGTASSIVASIPLIPGEGKDNSITLESLSSTLGGPVELVTAEVVARAVRQFTVDHQDILAISAEQLGSVEATQVTDYLWQTHAIQVVAEVPVRSARLTATINQGNLVVIGATRWGSTAVGTTPSLSASDALAAGFGYVGGRTAADEVRKEPALEIVTFTPAGRSTAYVPGGPIGSGYGHRLVWSFGFERAGERGLWEVLVDADTGEVIALQDTEASLARRIKGGAYPLTNTDVCPSADKCGVMKPDYPMPWADYLQVPDPPYRLYANGAGLFDYQGTATTTLTGKYVTISPGTCGTLQVSAETGDIDLAGNPGDHDCIQQAGGNSPAARTAFYEVGKLNEIARGWLPTNAWLAADSNACPRTPPTIGVNRIPSGYCKAGYTPQSTPSTIRFELPVDCHDASPTPTIVPNTRCRNLGEIASVISHEWGHALDDNDRSCSGNNFSNTAEAYADIVAMYRHQMPCTGYGRLTDQQNQTLCANHNVCDPTRATVDGTGIIARENQVGDPGVHCDVDCSGFRNSDYRSHDGGQPDTPSFVCDSCVAESSLCGREKHCAAAPVTQAAWDLAVFDLRQSPFGYDSVTAFNVASKLFYQGSTNVWDWYSCDCASGLWGGCGAVAGYIQWLAADDDNGDYFDGTPHMTALSAAFGRHEIGCPGLEPINSGCGSGPAQAPTLSLSMSPIGVDLAWSAVTGATKYWVFRTEGHASCNLGRALIGRPTGTSLTDTEVVQGRAYYYAVTAAGNNGACFGPSSLCKRADMGTAADHQTGPGAILGGTHVDTHIANDVREAFQETLQGGVSRLAHTWRFENVPAGTTSPALVFEGYRPNNSESDDFQFYYSTDGQTFTSIAGAVINKVLELTGGISVTFGTPGLSGTIYIQVQDTNQATGTNLDRVYVDYLTIRVQ